MNKNPSIIPINLLIEMSIRGFEKNLFIQNLRYAGNYPFERDDVWEVIKMYRLGTVETGFRFGGCIFPYIDEKHQIRALQVKTFDDANYETGTDFLPSMIMRQAQRDKKETPPWVQPYQETEHKLSCFFGTHLLTEYPKNPIAIVSKPDTAIYSSLYLGNPKPDGTGLLWLSSYGYETLTVERCKPLAGRTVILFPDLSPGGVIYKSWRERAAHLSSKIPGIKVVVSDQLQNNAPENALTIGMVTIADYFRQFDWRDFRPSDEPETEVSPVLIEPTEQVKEASVITPDDLDCPF